MFSSFAVELVSFHFQNGEKGLNPEEKATPSSDALNATHGAVESSDSSSLVDWQLMTVRTREVVPALSPDSTSDDNWDYYARIEHGFISSFVFPVDSSLLHIMNCILDIFLPVDV